MDYAFDDMTTETKTDITQWIIQTLPGLGEPLLPTELVQAPGVPQTSLTRGFLLCLRVFNNSEPGFL